MLHLQVHERQTARMKTRSEWFLNPGYRMASSMDSDPTLHVLRGSNNVASSGNIGKYFYLNKFKL